MDLKTKSGPKKESGTKVEIEVKSLLCVVCNAATDGLSYDIYTTLTESSRCVLADFITKTSQTVFERDKVWSQAVCKDCYDLLIQLDVAEVEFNNLKNEFLLVIGKNLKVARLSSASKQVVTCHTQTDEAFRGKIEFCSVEVKDEFDDDSRPATPLLDSDSDNEPLAKNKEVDEKASVKQVVAKVKGEVVTVDVKKDPDVNAEPYTCRECDGKFTSKGQAAVHAFTVHRIDLVKDPGVILRGDKACRTRRAKSLRSKRKTYVELGNSDEEVPADDDEEWSTSKQAAKERAAIKVEGKERVVKTRGKRAGTTMLKKPIHVRPMDESSSRQLKTASQLQKKLANTCLTIKKVMPIKEEPSMSGVRQDRIVVVGQADASSVLSQLQLVGLQVSAGPEARRKVKPPKVMIPCSECEATFSTRARLDYHMVKHAASKSPFICEICGASYKHKKACDIHVGMHKGISPWKCSECGKIFPSKGALSRHEAIHTGKPNYQCDLCGKSFIHTSSFKMHKLSHTGVKPHSCSKCGLALMTRSHLKRHQRVHSGEKRHECHICGKKFSERYNLYAHQKSHDSLAGVIQRQVKNHDCTVCDATFNRRYILEKHMETVHQRVMESGVKRPRNTMTKLLKKQASQGRTLMTESIGSSVVDAVDIKVLPPSPSTTPIGHGNTDSTSSTLMGENVGPSVSFQPGGSSAASPGGSGGAQQGRVPEPSTVRDPGLEGGPSAAPPHPWSSLAHYHLSNDYPLRMHGVDYAGYLSRQ